jgi:hypothetical protein
MFKFLTNLFLTKPQRLDFALSRAKEKTKRHLTEYYESYVEVARLVLASGEKLPPGYQPSDFDVDNPHSSLMSELRYAIEAGCVDAARFKNVKWETHDQV